MTPVWVDYDADTNRLLVNTKRGQQKEENARNDPRVAISMTDPDSPYRMLSVTGEVDEVIMEGAGEHIDELAQRHMGEDEYPNPIQMERILIAIRPERVSHFEA